MNIHNIDSNCKDAARRARTNPKGKLVLYRSVRQDEDYSIGISSKCHIREKYNSDKKVNICEGNKNSGNILNHVAKGSHKGVKTVFISFSLCAKTVAFWASNTYNKFLKVEVDYDPESITTGDALNIPNIIPLCDTTVRKYSTQFNEKQHDLVKHYYNASAEVLVKNEVPRKNITNIYRVFEVTKPIYDTYKDVVRVIGAYSDSDTIEDSYVNCHFITSCSKCICDKEPVKYLFVYEIYNRDVRGDLEIETDFDDLEIGDMKTFDSYLKKESLVRIRNIDVDDYDIYSHSESLESDEKSVPLEIPKPSPYPAPLMFTPSLLSPFARPSNLPVPLPLQREKVVREEIPQPKRVGAVLKPFTTVKK
jgi:hypothetical protein